MATIFGASGPTIEDVSHLEYICGKNAVTRSATIVTEYKGKGNREVDKYLDAGHKVFYNLNYERINKTGGGDKIANPFPKDLTKYKNLLEPIFKYYAANKNKQNLIMVCENEPTTKAFHSGPMADYIAMLKVFVDLGNQYGFKCVDGAVHIDRVLGAQQPKEGDDESLRDLFPDLDFGYEVYQQEDEDTYLRGKIDILRVNRQQEVTDLLNGYKTIPDLYAVNTHTCNVGGDYDSNKIKKAVDKIQSWVGKPTVCNENHVERTNNPELLTKIAGGYALAGVELVVYLSGAGGDDIDLNNGMNLTPFGTAYRNFIVHLKESQ